MSERRLGAADLALVTAVLPAHPGLHALSLRANPICAPQPWAREVKVGADDEGGEIDLGGVAALGRSLAELSVVLSAVARSVVVASSHVGSVAASAMEESSSIQAEDGCCCRVMVEMVACSA